MPPAAAGRPADVDVRFRRTATDLAEQGPPGVRLLAARGSGGASRVLRFSSGNGYPIEFLIDEPARRVEVAWSKPDEPESDLDSLLLGPALRCILELRGAMCLHAAAISVAGRAVVVAGAKGAGKSSLSGALARAGHPVLADDMAVLDERADGFWVQPGVPRLGLWPDTLTELGEDPDAWPRVLESIDKRWRPLTAAGDASAWRHETIARPLAAIWLLAADDAASATPALRPLAAAEAVVRLAEHARSPFMPSPPAPELLAGLSRVVSAIPVLDVRRPRGVDTLPALVDAIAGAAAATP